MSASPVASIQARIASLEARFDRLGAAPARVAVPGSSFAPAMQSALGVGAIDEVQTSGGDVTPSASAVYRTDTHSAVALLTGSAPSATRPAGELGGPVAAGTPFADVFEAAGAANGVPPRLLAAVGWVESRYRIDAVSPDGAIGVMQIMPMTAAELGVDPTDPVAAIHGAARLLAAHHDRFGSWDLALAAYHSGGGAVSRAGNTAPPRAAEYVRRVSDRLEQA